MRRQRHTAPMENIKGKILIVDDDPTLVRLMSLFLEDEGYEVCGVLDGFEGLQQVHKYQPDLIVLDIMMPRMDGWEVLQRIREDSDVPIIMLTAKAAPKDRVEGFSMGADDYVIKPFSMEELLLRIRSVLRRCYSAPARENARLKGIIAVLQQEADALKAQNARLAEEIKALQGRGFEADQQLRDYLRPEAEVIAAGFAHKMRNYLGAIAAWTTRLQKRAPQNDPNQKVYELIVKDAERSLDLVEDLVNTVRPVMPRSPEPIQVGELLAGISELATISENVRVDIDTASALPPVLGVRDELKLVLGNIVQNAIEAIGPMSGEVKISVTRKGGFIHFEVSDTGVGIPEEIQERLFMPFFSTKEQGLGLGLYLSKIIVESFNGDIGVRSQLGQGTTVWIDLPIANGVSQ